MLFLLSLSLSLLAGRLAEVGASELSTSSFLYHVAAVNSSNLGGSKIATAWYTGWHSQDFPLSKVSWSKYTHMTYAFAITTPDVHTLSLQQSDEVLLPQFVSTAHKHGVKASLSIGGWTGSRWFSPNVGSAGNRTAFVKSVTDMAQKYKLDGIDFDWEFPNQQGVGCNIINPNDTTNFLSFLQELRKHPLGATLTLSAATWKTPFVNSAGTSSTDVSGFSKVLDYIAIMNYDIWNSLSVVVGPNAPLDDTCATSANRNGSAVSAVKAWKDAGMPNNQIVLGVPSYGHSFRVGPSAAFETGSTTTLAAFPMFNASNVPTGDAWSGGVGPDVCGVQQGYGGVYNFWGLIAEGFLNQDGSAKKEIVYTFDECSQTPYVYNANSQIMVSFDNPQSFAAKGDFIKANELRGFAMWEVGGDSGDQLLDSILSATVYGDPTNSSAQTPPSSSSSPNDSLALSRDIPIKWILVYVFISRLLYST